jgi:hypothetical protein
LIEFQQERGESEMHKLIRFAASFAAAAVICVVGCGGGSSGKNTGGGLAGGLGGAMTGGNTMATECTAAAGDTPCGAALKANCCAQVMACNADTTCVNCVTNGCATDDQTTVNLLNCFCTQSVCAAADAEDCAN